MYAGQLRVNGSIGDDLNPDSPSRLREAAQTSSPLQLLSYFRIDHVYDTSNCPWLSPLLGQCSIYQLPKLPQPGRSELKASDTTATISTAVCLGSFRCTEHQPQSQRHNVWKRSRPSDS